MVSLGRMLEKVVVLVQIKCGMLQVLVVIVSGILQVLVILACVMVTFLVFRHPSWVLLLLPQPSDTAEFDCRLLFSCTHFSLHTLALCAPALNPFLYTLVHQTYRHPLSRCSVVRPRRRCVS